MAKLILADRHDALRAANLPADKAWSAATADFDCRIERIETKLPSCSLCWREGRCNARRMPRGPGAAPGHVREARRLT
jgi:hypothetical protein